MHAGLNGLPSPTLCTPILSLLHALVKGCTQQDPPFDIPFPFLSIRFNLAHSSRLTAHRRTTIFALVA